MPEADQLLGLYLHLVRASQLRQQPMVRDKLLILAGVQAQEMGLEPIAALCRHKTLAHNAHHLVGQWPTLAAALANEEFHSYLKQLKRRYSSEKIEHMAHSLGIELGRERETYSSDLEYAAALLDTRPDQIGAILAAPPDSPSAGREVSHLSGDNGTRLPSPLVGPGKADGLLNLFFLAPLLVGILLWIVLTLWRAMAH